MATTYPLALPSLSLTVAGADRTDEVVSRTLVIRAIAGASVDTCRFSLKSPESWRGAATTKPTVGQEVVVQLQTGTGVFSRLFGGTVEAVRDARVGFKTVRWDVECVDYTELLGRTLVNRTYQGMTASQVATDILLRYAPTVSSSGVQTTTDTIVAITFATRTPADCLTELAQLAGYEWYVTPDKVLRFYVAGTYASPNSVTDSSENFHNLEIEPQLQQVRNRVTVQGGTALSAEVVEQWDQSDSNTAWPLSRGNLLVDLAPSLDAPTRAMTIDGVAQPLQRVPYDEAAWAGGFLLDDRGREGGAQVRKPVGTETPANGARIEFRYRERLPITVIRENQASMLTVARLASEDYETVVSGHGPLHWWRMNELAATFPANAVNRGVSRAYASDAYYSTLYSGSLQPGVEGALVGDTDPAVEFAGTDGRLVCASGIRISETAYTLEAWVQAPGQSNRGVVSNYRDSALLGGVVLYTATNGDYTITHRGLGGVQETLVPDQSAAPTRAAYDHVVATYQINGAWLYVNGRLVASGTLIRPKTTELVDGVEIGSYDYAQGSPPHNFSGRIDEVAIYDRGLSPTEVLAHYHAGVWGGVREAVITDPNLGSLDRARKAGDAALARWANVVTDIRFESYVPGWQVGDTVTVSVTSAGTGRDYSGTALIQEVEYVWLGAQRVLYRVHCVATRYNWFDWQRDLAAPKLEPPHGAALSIVTAVESTAQLVPAVPAATSNSLPFVVAPDWGTIALGGDPVRGFVRCEMWQVPSTGEGSF